MVNIREYQARDRERLEECTLELQEFEYVLEPDRIVGAAIAARNVEDLVATVAQERAQIFVVEVDGDVVGFVCVCIEHREDLYFSTLTDYGYVSDLVVLSSHRGQGYGTALLQRAEEYARQHGMTALKIQVLARNPQAISVYQHAGFRPYELSLLKSLD